jgi:WD40 repeat protein
MNWRHKMIRALTLLVIVLLLTACTSPASSPSESIQMITWAHQGITAVAWSPDSTRLAVLTGDGVWLYDLTNEETPRQKLDSDGRATSVAFNGSGEVVAVGWEDGRIQLWSVASEERMVEFWGHDAPVTSLAFNLDGTLLASGAGQWIVGVVPEAKGVEMRLWDVATGERRAALSDDMIVPPVTHLAFSPDGTTLVVGQQGHGCTSPRCAEGRLRFWQPDAGVMAEMTVGHEIAFSGNGRFVAALGQSYESERLQIWDIETMKLLPAPTAVPEGYIFDLALSRDGSTAAVAAGEYGIGGQTAFVWDAATGTELAVLEAGNPIALSGDGRFLVSGPVDSLLIRQNYPDKTDKVYLWDIKQGTELAQLAELDGEFAALDFSPDSKWLAVTENDMMGSLLHLIPISQ